MRIAYLLYWDLLARDGVLKKVESQMASWRKMGCEVQAFCLSSKEPRIAFDGSVYRTDRFRHRLLPNMKLIGDLQRYNPQVIYLRYHLPDITLCYLLCRYRSVVEINSDNIRELRGVMNTTPGIRSSARYWLNLCLRWVVFFLSSGVVSPTHELSRRWHTALIPRPCRVVPNSLDMDRVRYRKQSRPTGDRPARLFFLGTAGQSWHGVDLLENLARELGDEVEVHVIGQKRDSGPANIRWHGFLDEMAYREIVQNADIAVGSLALFRNGMREACPLKVREYLAAGFPVIMGYDDTSFWGREIPPWICRIHFRRDGTLPESELSRVRRFLKDFASHIVDSRDAGPLISSDLIETERVSFLRSIIRKDA